MFVEEKIDFLIEMVKSLREEINRKEAKGIMGVQDIADYLGVSRNALYNSKRYLLPNFGEVEEGFPMEWTKGEVFAWLDRGLKNLKREWDVKQLDDPQKKKKA